MFYYSHSGGIIDSTDIIMPIIEEPTHDNVEARMHGDCSIERDDVGVLQFGHDANL